jgi:mRNA interferase HicA
LWDEEQRVQALAGRSGSDLPAKGSHFRVLLNGKASILPMHNKDLGKGLVESIKKQLGLK